MNTTIAIGLTCVSGVVFLINLWLALVGFRYARTQEEFVEASGAFVPAVGCILVAVPPWLVRGWFCAVLVCLGVFLIVLGRAGYEWFVFDVLISKRRKRCKTTANQSTQR